MNSREAKKSKFHELYTKAKKLQEAGHYHEARKQYIQMLNNYSLNDVDYTDYICVMGELGSTQRELNLFTDSKNRFLKGIALLNEANKYSRKASDFEIQKEKYQLYSNLGLVLCSEAQRIQDKNSNYENFKKLIDDSLSYYRICEEIVVGMIVESYKIQSKHQNLQWWKKEYIAFIVNILNPLELEAFEFNSKETYCLMLKLIQRAQTFYSMCNKNTRKHLEVNLSKSYYYKALCLRFLGKNEESSIYFKKDFNFCQKNNQKEDLQKTRLQMILFYMANFQFKEAKQYAKLNSHITQINEAENSYFKLMRTVRNMETRFEQGLQVEVDDLEDLLYQMNEMKCNKQAFEFNKKARNTAQFRQNQKFRYWLEYYASETHFKLENYTEALKFVKQALELAKKQPLEIAWCLLQQAIILEKIETDRTKVHHAFQQCIEKSKVFNPECLQQCLKEFQEFKIKEKRGKREFKIDEIQYKRLLDHFNKQKLASEERRLSAMQELEVSDQSSEEEEIFQPQRRLVKAANPLSKYVENCKIASIEPLQKFKQILSESQQIDLESMIFFPSEQVLALITSAPFIQNMDLRNFILTLEMLKGVHESQTVPNIKSLKLNMINASLNSTKDQIYDQLCELLRKIPFLQSFTISNLYKTKQIQTMIEVNSSGSFQTLKTLKLKQCQIEDKDLTLFNLGQKLPQLKKLSLPKNNIEGHTLGTLTQLKELEQLSLSQNPLSNVSLTKNFQSLKKISLNNLSDKISHAKYQNFIPLLINCSTIKMKNCPQVCTDILKVLVEYIIEFETELSNLKQLNLFGSAFKAQELINVLWRFERNAPNLKVIDVRNCKIVDVQQGGKIVEEIRNFGNVFVKGRNGYGRIEQQNPENIRNFKFENCKSIHMNNPKAVKNFNVN